MEQFRSGLQPSDLGVVRDLGLRPGWYVVAPLALSVVARREMFHVEHSIFATTFRIVPRGTISGGWLAVWAPVDVEGRQVGRIETGVAELIGRSSAGKWVGGGLYGFEGEAEGRGDAPAGLIAG